jgi:perosamine synthetase
MKIRRTLPPVGYRVPLGDLMSSAVRAGVARGHRESVFEPGIGQHFGMKHVRAVSSGKTALTLILLALRRLSRRTKVIIPAYTCYSLPSAIVKAGLEVVPCDIARGSFDYDYDQLARTLGPDVLCVLSVHLFGVPSDTQRLNALCRGTGIYVIEDAAQALGGVSQGKRLGTQADISFFSLGRGKNITCGSGGIVITNSDEIGAAIAQCSSDLSSTSPMQDASNFVALTLLRLFISPSLYWFPAGLPFLKLGETIFHEQFPMRWLSDFQAMLLRDWPARLAGLDAIRRRNAEYYGSHIRGVSAQRNLPYLRFPVVLPGRSARDRVLAEQDGPALGVSGMYPDTVAGIPQLRGRFDGLRFPEAERVAASLVTLPTHPLVSETDRTRIVALMNDAFAHASTADISGADVVRRPAAAQH